MSSPASIPPRHEIGMKRCLPQACALFCSGKHSIMRSAVAHPPIDRRACRSHRQVTALRTPSWQGQHGDRRNGHSNQAGPHCTPRADAAQKMTLPPFSRRRSAMQDRPSTRRYAALSVLARPPCRAARVITGKMHVRSASAPQLGACTAPRPWPFSSVKLFTPMRF